MRVFGMVFKFPELTVSPKCRIEINKIILIEILIEVIPCGWVF